MIYLAVGPKISPDSTVVITEALTGQITDAHPVMYTMAFRIFALPFNAIGHITIGVYLFCFFQLLIIAAIVSYAAYTIYRYGVPMWAAVGAVLYYATSIVFAVNSVSIWKDTIFNASLLLLMCFLLEIYKSNGDKLKDWRFMLKLTLVFLSVCFLRGNGWFVCVAVAIILAITYIKNIKSVIIFLLPLLIVVKIITGPIYQTIGISNLGSTELAGILIQQVGAVAASGGEISEEHAEVIGRFSSVENFAESYNPHTPDYIKGSINFDYAKFDENLYDFINVWANIGIKNIGTYFNAWALQTIGFWSHGYDDCAGIATNDLNGYAGINGQDFVSLSLPGNANVGEEILANLKMLSLGSMIWLMLFCAAIAIAKREIKKLLVISPALFLWIGLLLGAPRHYDFRYIMLVPLCVPILILLVFQREKQQI